MPDRAVEPDYSLLTRHYSSPGPPTEPVHLAVQPVITFMRSAKPSCLVEESSERMGRWELLMLRKASSRFRNRLSERGLLRKAGVPCCPPLINVMNHQASAASASRRVYGKDNIPYHSYRAPAFFGTSKRNTPSTVSVTSE